MFKERKEKSRKGTTTAKLMGNTEAWSDFLMKLASMKMNCFAKFVNKPKLNQKK